MPRRPASPCIAEPTCPHTTPCPVHADDRGTTTERGYGADHQTVRAQVAPMVEAGAATCWRCGDPIDPDGPWDLGHDDHDRSIYRGPEHPGCNRATSSRRRRRRQGAP